MDNGDFIDRSSISGTESCHITMQVLYQEILSAHESKPRASEMKLSKGTARLPQELQCQDLTHHVKPPMKPSLPPKS